MTQCSQLRCALVVSEGVNISQTSFAVVVFLKRKFQTWKTSRLCNLIHLFLSYAYCFMIMLFINLHSDCDICFS
ncbi:hypothetical protein Hanom_Chr10g00940241 [Helianthus anomalus]